MLPFGNPMLAAAGKAVKRIGVVGAPDGGISPALVTIGARDGDLAVALAFFGATAASAGGPWTRGVAGSNLNWRRLTAADIGSGVSLARGGPIAVYRGANDLALIASSSAASGSSATMSRQEMSANHAGFIAVTRSLAAGFADVDVDMPAGFSKWGRGDFYNGVETPSAATTINAFDRTQPEDPLYDREPFTFSWGGTGGTKYLYLFELRLI